MLHPRARTMLILSVPAILIGIACSLILIVAMKVAALLQRVLWSNLPAQLGVSADSPLWIIAMLTATGIAVGLVIRYSPGHAGPDPATESLIGAPIATGALPGLLAAAAGALTTGLFFHPHFSLPIPHYGQMRFVDILSGIIVALIAIAVGMVAVWCLPRLHALMHRLKNPILTLGIGGLLLGIVGTIGGPLTLFKGLDEMQQLAFSQTLTAADFLLIALVKLAALVLASASGFRGGRIFPAVFVGVALGLMLHAHVDAVPAAITVSCAILGMVLVVTRDGWLSLFMAAVVVPDTTLLPLLCMVMLPAWLLLAGRPLMIAKRHTD
ncbi:ion channel protein [Klebsiella pneumoniae]|nr:ion channel protein [Klebsiella pneumoniae]